MKTLPAAKPRLRIGLDVDGVMYEWDKTARYMLRTQKGYTRDQLGQESSHWDEIQEVIEKDDWNWLWNGAVKDGLFRYGNLYTGTVEGVRALSKLADCVVITHRPAHAVQDTLDWLSYLRLPWREIHIMSNKEAKSSVKCDIYVDDKGSNIIDYATNTDGIALLWRRRWNEAEQPGLLEYNRVDTVETWDEVVENVKRLG